MFCTVTETPGHGTYIRKKKSDGMGTGGRSPWSPALTMHQVFSACSHDSSHSRLCKVSRIVSTWQMTKRRLTVSFPKVIKAEPGFKFRSGSVVQILCIAGNRGSLSFPCQDCQFLMLMNSAQGLCPQGCLGQLGGDRERCDLHLRKLEKLRKTLAQI